MRKAILDILTHAQSPVSGEELSKKLGVSRVAVWKHIQTLKKLGYGIESNSLGYRLLNRPDLLLPEELGDLGIKVYHFQELPSTMDVARKLAQKGETALVIAETQTHGKGRLGRNWHSDKGGIYFSLILRPHVYPASAHLLCLMTAICVAKAIRHLYGLKAKLKWPNDVLIGGKKVCGILAEMEAEMDMVKYINLGVGINANNNISYYANTAVSLKELLSKEVNRKALLIEVLNQIKYHLGQPEEKLTQLWTQLSDTLGKKVRVIAPRQIFEGEAISLDTDGALIVKTAQGIKKVVAGDCIHLR